MLPSFFVTATGTNVGKTLFSSLFFAKYKEVFPYKYWKPIQTGSLESKDRDSVALASELPPNRVEESFEEWELPASPHYARKMQNGIWDETIFLKVWMQVTEYPVLIEGAGGPFVPLADNLLTVDWIKERKIPVILVVSSELGTINHSLSILEALSLREILVYGFYMIGSENILRQDNAKQIESFSGIPSLGFTAIPKDKLNPMDFRAFAKTNFDNQESLYTILKAHVT